MVVVTVKDSMNELTDCGETLIENINNAIVKLYHNLQIVKPILRITL